MELIPAGADVVVSSKFAGLFRDFILSVSNVLEYHSQISGDQVLSGIVQQCQMLYQVQMTQQNILSICDSLSTFFTRLLPLSAYFRKHQALGLSLATRIAEHCNALLDYVKGDPNQTKFTLPTDLENRLQELLHTSDTLEQPRQSGSQLVGRRSILSTRTKTSRDAQSFSRGSLPTSVSFPPRRTRDNLQLHGEDCVRWLRDANQDNLAYVCEPLLAEIANDAEEDKMMLLSCLFRYVAIKIVPMTELRARNINIMFTYYSSTILGKSNLSHEVFDPALRVVNEALRSSSDVYCRTQYCRELAAWFANQILLGHHWDAVCKRTVCPLAQGIIATESEIGSAASTFIPEFIAEVKRLAPHATDFGTLSQKTFIVLKDFLLLAMYVCIVPIGHQGFQWDAQLFDDQCAWLVEEVRNARSTAQHPETLRRVADAGKQMAAIVIDHMRQTVPAIFLAEVAKKSVYSLDGFLDQAGFYDEDDKMANAADVALEVVWNRFASEFGIAPAPTTESATSPRRRSSRESQSNVSASKAETHVPGGSNKIRKLRSDWSLSSNSRNPENVEIHRKRMRTFPELSFELKNTDAAPTILPATNYTSPLDASPTQLNLASELRVYTESTLETGFTSILGTGPFGNKPPSSFQDVEVKARVPQDGSLHDVEIKPAGSRQSSQLFTVAGTVASQRETSSQPIILSNVEPQSAANYLFHETLMGREPLETSQLHDASERTPIKSDDSTAEQRVSAQLGETSPGWQSRVSINSALDTTTAGSQLLQATGPPSTTHRESASSEWGERFDTDSGIDATSAGTQRLLATGPPSTAHRESASFEWEDRFGTDSAIDATSAGTQLLLATGPPSTAHRESASFEWEDRFGTDSVIDATSAGTQLLLATGPPSTTHRESASFEWEDRFGTDSAIDATSAGTQLSLATGPPLTTHRESASSEWEDRFGTDSAIDATSAGTQLSLPTGPPSTTHRESASSEWEDRFGTDSAIDATSAGAQPMPTAGQPSTTQRESASIFRPSGASINPPTIPSTAGAQPLRAASKPATTQRESAFAGRQSRAPVNSVLETSTARTRSVSPAVGRQSRASVNSAIDAPSAWTQPAPAAGSAPTTQRESASLWRQSAASVPSATETVSAAKQPSPVASPPFTMQSGSAPHERHSRAADNTAIETSSAGTPPLPAASQLSTARRESASRGLQSRAPGNSAIDTRSAGQQFLPAASQPPTTQRESAPPGRQSRDTGTSATDPSSAGAQSLPGSGSPPTAQRERAAPWRQSAASGASATETMAAVTQPLPIASPRPTTQREDAALGRHSSASFNSAIATSSAGEGSSPAAAQLSTPQRESASRWLQSSASGKSARATSSAATHPLRVPSQPSTTPRESAPPVTTQRASVPPGRQSKASGSRALETSAASGQLPTKQRESASPDPRSGAAGNSAIDTISAGAQPLPVPSHPSTTRRESAPPGRQSRDSGASAIDPGSAATQPLPARGTSATAHHESASPATTQRAGTPGRQSRASGNSPIAASATSTQQPLAAGRQSFTQRDSASFGLRSRASGNAAVDTSSSAPQPLPAPSQPETTPRESAPPTTTQRASALPRWQSRASDNTAGETSAAGTQSLPAASQLPTTQRESADSEPRSSASRNSATDANSAGALALPVPGRSSTTQSESAPLGRRSRASGNSTIDTSSAGALPLSAASQPATTQRESAPPGRESGNPARDTRSAGPLPAASRPETTQRGSSPPATTQRASAPAGRQSRASDNLAIGATFAGAQPLPAPSQSSTTQRDSAPPRRLSVDSDTSGTEATSAGAQPLAAGSSPSTTQRGNASAGRRSSGPGNTTIEASAGWAQPVPAPSQPSTKQRGNAPPGRQSRESGNSEIDKSPASTQPPPAARELTIEEREIATPGLRSSASGNSAIAAISEGQQLPPGASQPSTSQRESAPPWRQSRDSDTSETSPAGTQPLPAAGSASTAQRESASLQRRSQASIALATERVSTATQLLPVASPPMTTQRESAAAGRQSRASAYTAMETSSGGALRRESASPQPPSSAAGDSVKDTSCAGAQALPAPSLPATAQRESAAPGRQSGASGYAAIETTFGGEHPLSEAGQPHPTVLGSAALWRESSASDNAAIETTPTETQPSPAASQPSPTQRESLSPRRPNRAHVGSSLGINSAATQPTPAGGPRPTTQREDASLGRGSWSAANAEIDSSSTGGEALFVTPRADAVQSQGALRQPAPRQQQESATAQQGAPASEFDQAGTPLTQRINCGGEAFSGASTLREGRQSTPLEGAAVLLRRNDLAAGQLSPPLSVQQGAASELSARESQFASSKSRPLLPASKQAISHEGEVPPTEKGWVSLLDGEAPSPRSQIGRTSEESGGTLGDRTPDSERSVRRRRQQGGQRPPSGNLQGAVFLSGGRGAFAAGTGASAGANPPTAVSSDSPQPYRGSQTGQTAAARYPTSAREQRLDSPPQENLAGGSDVPCVSTALFDASAAAQTSSAARTSSASRDSSQFVTSSPAGPATPRAQSPQASSSQSRAAVGLDDSGARDPISLANAQACAGPFGELEARAADCATDRDATTSGAAHAADRYARPMEYTLASGGSQQQTEPSAKSQGLRLRADSDVEVAPSNLTQRAETPASAQSPAGPNLNSRQLGERLTLLPATRKASDTPRMGGISPYSDCHLGGRRRSPRDLPTQRLLGKPAAPPGRGLPVRPVTLFTTMLAAPWQRAQSAPPPNALICLSQSVRQRQERVRSLEALQPAPNSHLPAVWQGAPFGLRSDGPQRFEAFSGNSDIRTQPYLDRPQVGRASAPGVIPSPNSSQWGARTDASWAAQTSQRATPLLADPEGDRLADWLYLRRGMDCAPSAVFGARRVPLRARASFRDGGATRCAAQRLGAQYRIRAASPLSDSAARRVPGRAGMRPTAALYPDNARFSQTQPRDPLRSQPISVQGATPTPPAVRKDARSQLPMRKSLPRCNQEPDLRATSGPDCASWGVAGAFPVAGPRPRLIGATSAMAPRRVYESHAADSQEHTDADLAQSIPKPKPPLGATYSNRQCLAEHLVARPNAELPNPPLAYDIITQPARKVLAPAVSLGGGGNFNPLLAPANSLPPLEALSSLEVGQAISADTAPAEWAPMDELPPAVTGDGPSQSFLSAYPLASLRGLSPGAAARLILNFASFARSHARGKTNVEVVEQELVEIATSIFDSWKPSGWSGSTHRLDMEICDPIMDALVELRTFEVNLLQRETLSKLWFTNPKCVASAPTFVAQAEAIVHERTEIAAASEWLKEQKHSLAQSLADYDEHCVLQIPLSNLLGVVEDLWLRKHLLFLMDQLLLPKLRTS